MNLAKRNLKCACCVFSGAYILFTFSGDLISSYEAFHDLREYFEGFLKNLSFMKTLRIIQFISLCVRF